MWMDAEDLVERTESLARMVRQAELNLRRPSASSPPWLRCTCAILVGAQLGRAIYQGVAVSAAGVSLAQSEIRAGNWQDAAFALRVIRQSTGLLSRAMTGVAYAGSLGFHAGQQIWAAPGLPKASRVSRLCRAVMIIRLGAVALRGGFP